MDEREGLKKVRLSIADKCKGRKQKEGEEEAVNGTSRADDIVRKVYEIGLDVRVVSEAEYQ